jgi:hypothetical protein
MVLLLVSSATIGAAEAAPVPAPETHVLNIEFRKPVLEKARTFVHMTGKPLFRFPASGLFYTRVSTLELKALFGLEISVEVVKGAGNSRGTDACFIGIKDMKTLKKGLKRLVRKIRIEDDPKFVLIDDAEAFDPR